MLAGITIGPLAAASATQWPLEHGEPAAPHITLISFARGEPYETSLQRMRDARSSFGDASKLLWTDAELRSDPLFVKHEAAFRELDDIASENGIVHRPFCAAFKPLMLIRAMASRSDGYVMWADSSKYFNMSDQGQADSVRGALRKLSWHGRTAFGLVHCSARCEEQDGPYARLSDLVNETAASLLDAGVPSMLGRRGLLNTNMIWEVTDSNRQLAKEWLEMALGAPRAFCSSNPQDQSALTLLALRHRLSVYDPCPKILSARLSALKRKEAQPPCSYNQKQLDTFLETIGSDESSFVEL